MIENMKKAPVIEEDLVKKEEIEEGHNYPLYGQPIGNHLTEEQALKFPQQFNFFPGQHNSQQGLYTPFPYPPYIPHIPLFSLQGDQESHTLPQGLAVSDQPNKNKKRKGAAKQDSKFEKQDSKNEQLQEQDQKQENGDMEEIQEDEKTEQIHSNNSKKQSKIQQKKQDAALKQQQEMQAYYNLYYQQQQQMNLFQQHFMQQQQTQNQFIKQQEQSTSSSTKSKKQGKKSNSNENLLQMPSQIPPLPFQPPIDPQQMQFYYQYMVPTLMPSFPIQYTGFEGKQEDFARMHQVPMNTQMMNYFQPNPMNIKAEGNGKRKMNKQLAAHKNPEGKETKNIPKNYARGIYKYIIENIDQVVQITGFSKEIIMPLLDNLRDKIHSIKHLREYWIRGEINSQKNKINKAVRILSRRFLNDEAYPYFYHSSRMKNPVVALKFRRYLINVLQDPENFYYLKPKEKESDIVNID